MTYDKQLQELIDYWEYRAEVLETEPTSGLAKTIAAELKDCANQIKKVLKKEPTEADGFSWPAKEQLRGGKL